MVDDPEKSARTQRGNRGEGPVSGRDGPTPAQRSYLARGVGQPGGKLPLFDREGREIARKTVRTCLDRGWCEPWFANPIKPDWIVCRLTAAGYRVVGAEPPRTPGGDG